MKTTILLLSRANRLARLAFAVLVTMTALRAEPQTTDKPAAEPRFALGAQGGTAGLGPVLTFTANKHFTASLGYTFLDFDYDVEDDDADYTGSLKFSNLQLLLNWHPTAGSFHLSAGAILTDNSIDLIGKPKAGTTYEFGGNTYTADQVGHLTGEVELHKGMVPYLGLGWSKKPTSSGFGFFANIGVIFSSAPEARLAANGPLASNPTFQSDLRKEEAQVNDELDDFKYYPIIQLGVLYRF